MRVRLSSARTLTTVMVLAVAMVLVPVPASASMFDCTEAGLDAAIAAGGGPHHFDCGVPTTVVTTSTKTISSDVFLDGDGLLTVSGGNTHTVFEVNSGAAVEFHNLGITAGNAPGPHESGGGIRVIESSLVNVVGSQIYGNTARVEGGGIGIADGGEVVVVESSIFGNVSDHGGGIGGYQATVSVIDSAVYGHDSGCHGGGFYISTGSLSIVRSRVYDNHSPTTGGGIYVRHTHFGLYDSEVSDNSADNYGGGVAIEVALWAAITGSQIHRNSAGLDGGGVYSDAASPLQIASTVITGNHALTGYGGGVSASSDLFVYSSYVAGNTASIAGGGIEARPGPLTIEGSEIASNTTDSGAGAGVAVGDAGLVMTDSVVHDNATTISRGGGIQSNGPVEILRSRIHDNHAGSSGGGVSMASAPALIVDSELFGNYAGEYGGAVYGDDADIELVRTDVHGNFGYHGGGVATWPTGHVATEDSRFVENEARYGGALWVDSLDMTASLVAANSAEGGAAGVLAGQAHIVGSALLANSDPGGTGSALMVSLPSTIESSCIAGNTAPALWSWPSGSLATGNWWGDPSGPSGVGLTGTGDEVATQFPAVTWDVDPWSDVPLGPCFDYWSPWVPGVPSSGVCEVLVWFDGVEVISDTDDEPDEWTVTGVMRFFDMDTTRDREIASIGITRFEGDTGDSVVLEKQWRTEMWGAYVNQVRLDDVSIIVTERDGRAGTDRGVVGFVDGTLIDCGETLSMSVLVPVAPLGLRGMPSTTDSPGLLQVDMTITAVPVTWMPPPRGR